MRVSKNWIFTLKSLLCSFNFFEFNESGSFGRVYIDVKDMAKLRKVIMQISNVVLILRKAFNQDAELLVRIS